MNYRRFKIKRTQIHFVYFYSFSSKKSMRLLIFMHIKISVNKTYKAKGKNLDGSQQCVILTL
jgi:hypothetical protein